MKPASTTVAWYGTIAARAADEALEHALRHVLGDVIKWFSERNWSFGVACGLFSKLGVMVVPKSRLLEHRVLWLDFVVHTL